MEKKLISLKTVCSSNSNNVFYTSEIALTKKILFSLGRKSVSTSQIKDIEKSIATICKSCCYFKKSLKKLVSNGSSLKIDFPLISIIVSASRKNLRIKQYCFQQTKNLISLARMKYWLKNMLQLAAISEKWRKNYFHWSEKQFSTSNNKLFLSKLFSSNSNNGFYQQQNSSDQKNTVAIWRKIRFHQLDERY